MNESEYSEEVQLSIKLQKLKLERKIAEFAEYVRCCEERLSQMKNKTYRIYNAYSWHIVKVVNYKKIYFAGDNSNEFPFFQIVGKTIYGNSLIMSPSHSDYYSVLKVDRNKIKKLLDIDCENIPSFNISNCETHFEIFTHGRDSAEKKSVVNNELPFQYFEEIPNIVFDEALKLYSKQALQFKEFFDTYGHNLILSDTKKK